MRKSPVLAGAAAILLLLAASPAAAQEADPTGNWEGRWRAEARHYIEGGATPRQLRHQGSLEASFEFCVGKDGAIGGTGTAKVRRRDAPNYTRIFESGTSNCQERFEPSEAEVPVKVTGQRQGEEFLLRLETGTIDIQQKGVCTVPGGPAQSWSNAFSAPAIWFVLFAGSSTNPVVGGLKIAAKDGADQKVRGSDAYDDNEGASTRGILEHRNRLQIRRPKDAAVELPVLLGQVFEEDTAEISADGEKKLQAVLPRLKCQPQGSSITVVTTGEDDLFVEALSRARLTHLQNWFREHGADTTSLKPRWRGGSADDVQVKFGQ